MRYEKFVFTIKRELVNAIGRFVETHPEYGYRGIADFMRDAIRRRAEEVKAIAPEEKKPPEERFPY